MAEESLSLHLYLCDSNSSSRMWRWWWGRGSSRKDQGPSHTALPFPRTIAQSDDRQSAVILRMAEGGGPCDTRKCVPSLHHQRLPCPARSLALSLARSLSGAPTPSAHWSKAEWMAAHGPKRKCVCAPLSLAWSRSLCWLCLAPSPSAKQCRQPGGGLRGRHYHSDSKSAT